MYVIEHIIEFQSFLFFYSQELSKWPHFTDNNKTENKIR